MYLAIKPRSYAVVLVFLLVRCLMFGYLIKPLIRVLYLVQGTVSAAGDPRLIFNPNVNANRPAVGTVKANTSYEVDATSKNFKYPQIWRTNVAVDQKLPWGVIGTVELSYTKDINAVKFSNSVLPDNLPATSTSPYLKTLPGIEGQQRYDVKSTHTGTTATDPSISPFIYMENTNKGYSYFITGSVTEIVLKWFQCKRSLYLQPIEIG